MPNEFLIKSNDTENGYIYRELNNRIIQVERTIEELYNIIQRINSSGVSLERLGNLFEEIEKRAKIEYVQNHIEDSRRHLSDVKIMEWDNKYEKPLTGIPENDLNSDVRRKLNSKVNDGNGSLLKFTSYIGNGYSKDFSYRHNLNTKDISVSIWDTQTNEMVFPNISIVDENTIQINFLVPPIKNQYRLVVVG
jgi:exonuclease VII small subunit